MAIEVEDGTGKANANSYASIQNLKDFASARRFAIPASNPELEALLMKAMDAMRGLDYAGSKATKNQALDWPRVGVKVNGFCYGADELPPALINAQCALAIEAQRTELLPTISANASGGMIERTVGPITRRWEGGGRSSTRPIVEKAKAYLSELLRTGGSNVRLSRG